MAQFKQSTYIENTPEAREWLEKLGYRKETRTSGKNILALNGGKYIENIRLKKENIKRENDKKRVIDCRGNFELFKALTALRDDSDFMQWLFNEEYKEFARCEKDNAFEYFKPDWCFNAHKATPEELIAHFKK